MKIQRDLQSGTIQNVPQQERADLLQFETGELDRNFDELTIQHGYGKLRARQGQVGPKGWLAQHSGGRHPAAQTSASP